MTGPVLLALSCAFLLVGAACVARAAGVNDALDLLVGVPVVAAGQIVLTLGIAGVLHRLDRPTVLGLNALVSFAAIVLTRPGLPSPPTRSTIARHVASVCRAQPLTAVLVGLAAFALAWRLVLAFVLPPYGYDALSYHLPTVIEWFQSGSLNVSPLNTCCAYYPANGELLISWVAILSGTSAFVDTAQIASAIIGGAAVAGIARASGLPSVGMWNAGAIFVLTPVVLAQANVDNVDVTFAALALAALYFSIRARQTPQGKRSTFLVLAGTASGLSLGAKPNGIVVVLAVALPLVVAALWHRTTCKRMFCGAALFFAPVMILGSIWYLRSWITTGNPFFPAEVRLLGVHLFEGRNVLTAPPPEFAGYPRIVDPLISWSRDLHFWTNNAYSAGQLVGGLGPVWSYFGAVLVIPFAVNAFRRCPPVFWHFVVPAMVIFLAQPYHWWARFSLTLVAVGAVAVAWATSAVGPYWLRRSLSVAVVALLAGSALIASLRVAPGARMLGIGVSDVSSAATGGQRSFGDLFNADYAWIDDLDTPARIAIDTRSVHITAPLAGHRFQHRLLALPRMQSLDRFVAEQNVDYVVVRIGTPLERRLRGRSGLFRPVGDQTRVQAFRVLP